MCILFASRMHPMRIPCASFLLRRFEQIILFASIFSVSHSQAVAEVAEEAVAASDSKVSDLGIEPSHAAPPVTYAAPTYAAAPEAHHYAAAPTCAAAPEAHHYAAPPTYAAAPGSIAVHDRGIVDARMEDFGVVSGQSAGGVAQAADASLARASPEYAWVDGQIGSVQPVEVPVHDAPHCVLSLERVGADEFRATTASGVRTVDSGLLQTLPGGLCPRLRTRPWGKRPWSRRLSVQRQHQPWWQQTQRRQWQQTH